MDGLEKLERLHDLFVNLPNKVPEFMKVSFEAIRPQVEDANIEQLQRGERADGSILPNYSFVSVSVYGKRPGPMTLKQEGDFHRGITLEVMEDGIELIGRDMKTEMLQLRYGDNIIGLQPETIQKIEADYLKNEMETNVKDYLTE